MNTNPYKIVFKEDKDSVSVAHAYHTRCKEVDIVSNASRNIAVSFMLCHVALGFKEACVLFNEVIREHYAEQGYGVIHCDQEKLPKQMGDFLSVLVKAGKEKEICIELADELVHAKNLNRNIHYLKPLYLNSMGY